MPPQYRSHLLRKLLVSGDYSDLLLTAAGTEFQVHKAIVFPQSPVIAAAFRAGFKNPHKPGETPEYIKAKLRTHIAVNVVAGFYKVPSLKELANSRIKHLLNYTGLQALLPEVVFAWTATEDEEVKEIAASVAANNIDMMIKSSSFREMEDAKEFSLKMFQACASRIAQLESRLEEFCGHARQHMKHIQPVAD
ncbi:hypothetical protein AK830_g9839 [Neonectria ditissima]|uniref:Uncharacterized protein n=1 Tax=Neonectria ditissima TaxID=78410 RepID=A0A0N8H5P0_9HYPO|nr:hypothetical protein AK830_g9839 [Neonectria ditissima]